MKHHLVGETGTGCSLPIKTTLPFPGFHPGLGAVLNSTCMGSQTESYKFILQRGNRDLRPQDE